MLWGQIPILLRNDLMFWTSPLPYLSSPCPTQDSPCFRMIGRQRVLMVTTHLSL